MKLAKVILTVFCLVLANVSARADGFGGGGGGNVNGQAIAPTSLNFASGIAYSGTSIQALGTVTGGSGYTQNSSILTLGTITAGSGYVQNTYSSVPLTGGTGSGAQAQIVVSSAGVVQQVIITNRGTGYVAADTLSASNTNLGGSGSGFSIPVATIGQVFGGVALTGGSGTGATATITVNSSGAVSAVGISNHGSGYAVSDSLGATSLAGGSGFSVPVSSVSAQSGPTNQWISIDGLSLTGSANIPDADGSISANHIYIGNDTVGTNGLGYEILRVEDGVGSGTWNGGRIAIHGFVAVVGSPASAPTSGLVGVQGNATVSANLTGTSGAYTNYAGTVFGGNSQVIGQSKATFIAIINGHEFDTSCEIGCSVAEKHGATIVETADDANQGLYDDSALEISSQDATNFVGWKTIIQFGGYAHKAPSNSSTTLIGIQNRVVPSPATVTAGHGVDMSAGSFTNDQYKGTGWLIDPNGNDMHTGTTAPTMAAGTLAITGLIAAPTLGANDEGIAFVTAANGLGLEGEGSAYDAALYDDAGAVAAGVVHGNAWFEVPNLLAVGSNNFLTTGDAVSILKSSAGYGGITIDNNNGGTGTFTAINLGNGTSAQEAIIRLNGSSFSGGIGANGLSVSVAASGAVLEIGTGTEVLQFGSSGMFTANGTTTACVGTLGPSGVSATVRKWLTIKDNGAVVGYIPVC